MRQSECQDAKGNGKKSYVSYGVVFKAKIICGIYGIVLQVKIKRVMWSR